MENNVINLSNKRQPVNYTIRISHHWDDRLEVFVENVSDDERSKRTVADTMERAADTFRAESQPAEIGENAEPAWNRIDAINAWGRVTSELSLPWGASASRVIEVIEAIKAERDALKTALASADALLEWWSGTPGGVFYSSLARDYKKKRQAALQGKGDD